jgi:hypothetical protein
MPNLLIKHDGMYWPLGAVVDADATFLHGYSGHLKLGAVELTERPITHGQNLDLPPPPKDQVEAQTQNNRLRAQLVQAEAKIAGLIDDLDAANKDRERLLRENAEQRELLDQVTTVQHTEPAAFANLG